MILNIAKRVLTERQVGRKVADLAEEMGVCRQRVEQIWHFAVRKIKRDILPENSDNICERRVARRADGA